MLLVPAPAAVAAAESPGPDLDATAWILVDAAGGERLTGEAESRPLPIASATKLMTAYVALERGDLGEKLTAPAYDALPVESVLGLDEGERITVDQAIVAMMLPSANDAAVTVAQGLAGSTPRFVEWMNDAAGELGLADSGFTNPIGLDDPGHLSSARDLATLTIALRENRRFREIVDSEEAVIETSAAERPVVSRNTLLAADPSVDGVKTGHTLGAGYVLVGSAERQGVELVSVVLGAASEAARDAETAELLDYGFSLYGPRRAIDRDEQLAGVAIAGGEDELGLLAARGVEVRARDDQELEVDVEAPEEVEGPIAAGTPLGSATVSLDGATVDRVRLLAASGVGAPSLIDDVGGGGALVLILLGAAAVILIAVVLLRSRAADREAGRTHEERRIHRERRQRRRQGD